MRLIDINRRISKAETALPPKGSATAAAECNELIGLIQDYFRDRDGINPDQREWFDGELCARFDEPGAPYMSRFLEAGN